MYGPRRSREFIKILVTMNNDSTIDDVTIDIRGRSQLVGWIPAWLPVTLGGLRIWRTKMDPCWAIPA
jgi:hypothetical protein